jgi:hypothetical protein
MGKAFGDATIDAIALALAAWHSVQAIVVLSPQEYYLPATSQAEALEQKLRRQSIGISIIQTTAIPERHFGSAHYQIPVWIEYPASSTASLASPYWTLNVSNQVAIASHFTTSA